MIITKHRRVSENLFKLTETGGERTKNAHSLKFLFLVYLFFVRFDTPLFVRLSVHLFICPSNGALNNSLAFLVEVWTSHERKTLRQPKTKKTEEYNWEQKKTRDFPKRHVDSYETKRKVWPSPSASETVSLKLERFN